MHQILRGKPSSVEGKIQSIHYNKIETTTPMCMSKTWVHKELGKIKEY